MAREVKSFIGGLGALLLDLAYCSPSLARGCEAGILAGFSVFVN